MLSFKISHIFYYIRYWLGFYILPNTYKKAIEEFNQQEWQRILEESDKFKKELRSRKHIKLVQKKNKKSTDK